MQIFTIKRGSASQTTRAVLFTFLLAFIYINGQAQAPSSGKYYIIDYPGNTDGLPTPVTYTLWVPDGVKKIRGIIVHQHGAGTTASKEGSTAAYDLHWQALAKKWDCALLGPSYHVTNEAIDLTPGGSEVWFDPRHGSEKTFLRSLNEFATQTHHPEIATVPWALWGHSGGGIWSDVMATLHPDRIVAVWLRSGSSIMFRTKPEFPQPIVPDATYTIPYMSNPGIKELKNLPYIGTLNTFKEYRAKGSPIGFAPDPRTGHETGDSRYLAIPWLDACLALRLPAKNSKTQQLKPIDQNTGWLAAPLSSEAVPYAQYKANVNEAVWLPNEAVAKAWAEYVQVGSVSDDTPPPSPYGVKVADNGDQGRTIVWNAEADFESGIRQFIIIRDGQVLARVPENPRGQFGRPLFQPMTYHDTPGKPLSQMTYTDTSVKPGEKHTYAVSTVNSVELISEPSKPTKP
jgi:poly(3-hydroxybutyrate) depolymerase